MVLRTGFLLYFLALSVTCYGRDVTPFAQLEQLQEASLLARDSHGKTVLSIAANKIRTPASTLKILTAWLAINHWGLEHKFCTDFYIDDKQVLWIKGYGDPFLISEEIDAIALALRNKGLKEIKGLGIDGQFFSDEIKIDGQSTSNNPYDAPLAALSANFNTLYLKRTSLGIESAEPQTPLTPIAKQLGVNIQGRKIRINIKNKELSGRYFGEILIKKLHGYGVGFRGRIASGERPVHAQFFYRHYNSHNLTAVLKAMLQYSTNFVANQLFLMLGADYYGPPATLGKAQRYANQQITRQFHWKGFYIYEGAGLSRKNQISATQFIELLHEFLPYRKLLVTQIDGIYAKTGTLRGVSNYAGFIDSTRGPVSFALFIDTVVPSHFRLDVARQLQEVVNKKGTISHQHN
jgi:D-alanyl-D-alanine carboxypeptidase/D-alanyl-D-alanine-endopeptidase (penicillin-binding protein 4)